MDYVASGLATPREHAEDSKWLNPLHLKVSGEVGSLDPSSQYSQSPSPTEPGNPGTPPAHVEPTVLETTFSGELEETLAEMPSEPIVTSNRAAPLVPSSWERPAAPSR